MTDMPIIIPMLSTLKCSQDNLLSFTIEVHQKNNLMIIPVFPSQIKAVPLSHQTVAIKTTQEMFFILIEKNWQKRSSMIIFQSKP